MTKKIKNTTIYLIPSLVGAILPIISLPLFTRVLTMEEYGALALCQTYSIFINGISNFGLNIGYERDFFEKSNKKEGALLYTTLLFVIVTYLIFGVITFFAQNHISTFLFKNIKYNNLLLITYFATGMTSLKSFYLIYFKNNEDALKFVWYTLDESIIGFLVSIFLVIYLRIGISGIVFAQLFSSGFVFLLLTKYFINKIKFSLDFIAFKKSLSLSLPLSPRFLFGIVGSQFDKYILGVMSSLGVVGVYSIAQRITGIIFTFMTAIQNVWAPRVYRLMFEEKENGPKLIGVYLNPFFYISVACGLFISLFSEEILYFLAPKEYSDASSIIIVLSILYVSYFFGKQNQLVYTKKTHIISILTLMGIFINVVFNYIFVSFWGLMGIAWGNLLGGLLSGGISFLISQYYYRIIWNSKSILFISIIYVGFSLLILLLIYFQINYYFRFSIKLLAFVIYVYAGFRMNIINRVKIEAIKLFISNRMK
jgi:O-antigen/teichoic acid export membrane protein